jgi:hypothetical protein
VFFRSASSSAAGDRDFLMNGQEFATAVHYRLAIVVVLIDNGMYGTIRMHQEREFPGRVIASNLRNPGFGGLHVLSAVTAKLSKKHRSFFQLSKGPSPRILLNYPCEDRSRGDNTNDDLDGNPFGRFVQVADIYA